MQKVAIYCRLSKEDIRETAESESIQNQKNMLLEYAHKKGWEIYNIYTDDGISAAYSGEENERPAFLSMINDAKLGKFNIVLCKSQSRFSRNTEVIEKYIHGLFVEKNIRFISIVDYADTEVKGNKKARQINGLINEWYLEDLSENVKSVLESKMRRGEYIGSFAPYGYKKDEKNHNKLVINENTAGVVKNIFRWCIEGWGTVKICRMLNEMQIPNPRKQQELDGMRIIKMYDECEVGKWRASTVNDILHNAVYMGSIVQHKAEKLSYKHKRVKKVDKGNWIVVEGMHEPIISAEDFEKVGEILGKKRRSDGLGRVHILSGLVHCGECGCIMQKNHSGNKDYLRCRDKYLSGEDKCKTPSIRLDFVLQAINFERIKGIIIKFVSENADKFNKGDNIEKDRIEKQISELESEKQKYEKAKKNLYMDKCMSVISENEYFEYKQEFEDKLSFISEKIENIRKSFSTRKTETAEDILKRINIEKMVLDSLIERIVVNTNSENREIELKIVWKNYGC